MNELKRRFAKDCKIPIPVTENFDYYMDLYGDHFHFQEHYDEFQRLLKTFSGSDITGQFLDAEETLMKRIIEVIQKTDAYQSFQQMDMSKYGKLTAYPKTNIYSQAFIGKRLVSIDLEQANFQALSHVSSDLVLGAESYRELVMKFTPYSYYWNSKGFRSCLFGNLNPKRQQKIEEKLIREVLDFMKEHYEISIVSVLSDELILEMDPIHEESLKEILESTLGLKVHVKQFQLTSIVSPKDGQIYGYVKEFEEGNPSFKAVNGDLFPQVFKFYYGMEINEKDLEFRHMGKTARFVEPIF